MHAMAGTGRVIAGRYRLKEPIGRGAMGTVWRAWDEILDREVAVKELRISDSLPPDERGKAYQRTHREARTAARLSHPGLVTVFDVAEEDGRPWIVMELVTARSLDRIIAQDGPLSPPRAAEAGRQLLAALATAHAAGVLHRDVKPSNVLLAGGGRAVLTDFGIATFQGDPKLTQTGMVMGSPGFTAPERIQGNPATPASDLWSLGATLYAAVEGHGPFDRVGGAITTMSAIINTDPPAAPPAAGLGPVIDALLRRNPADRPDAATAARMLGAVGPQADGTADGSTYTPVRPRGPEPDSQGAPATPAAPAASATPAPEAFVAPGTSVDMPAQADRTVPVETPAARRAAAEQALARADTGWAGNGSGQPPAALFAPPGGASRHPEPVRPPAQRNGSAPAPRQNAAPGSAAPGSAAPGNAAARAGAGTATRTRRRAPLRAALVALAALVLVIAATAGVIAWRHHQRSQLSTGARQAAAPTAESPVTAAAGAASTGPLPTGYRWYRQPAAKVGSNAGFTVAIPDDWQVSIKGSGTYFEAPEGNGTFLQIDLTPHTYRDMVYEAHYLSRLTQQQGRFPGYVGLGISAANIRGSSGAAWQLSYQNPTLGRLRALDLMYIAATSAGSQSYALYVSSPDPAWNRNLATFDEEIRTFRPVP